MGRTGPAPRNEYEQASITSPRIGFLDFFVKKDDFSIAHQRGKEKERERERRGWMEGDRERGREKGK